VDQGRVARHTLVHGAARGNQAVNVGEREPGRIESPPPGFGSETGGGFEMAGEIALTDAAGALNGTGGSIELPVKFRAGRCLGR